MDTNTTDDDGGGGGGGSQTKSEKDVTFVLSSATAAATEGTGGVLWCDLPNASHVRPLDETNFLETVRENRCVLVFFHAKWCSECEPMKHVFVEVTSALDGPCCIAAAVDCTTDFKLAIENSVDQLPTVTLFSNGERVDEYRGNRSAVDLQRFIDGATSTLCGIPNDDDVPAATSARGPKKKAKAKKNKTNAAKKSPKKQPAVKNKINNTAKPKS